MTTQNVPGFGIVDAHWVVIRAPRQSFACHERKSYLNISNDCDASAYFIRLDKGFLTNGKTCDYSISASIDDETRACLLELKGCHEEEAIDQLGQTLRVLRHHPNVTAHIQSAIFVPAGGSLMPSAGFQKCAKTFYKWNRIPLHRLSNHSHIFLSAYLQTQEAS